MEENKVYYCPECEDKVMVFDEVEGRWCPVCGRLLIALINTDKSSN